MFHLRRTQRKRVADTFGNISQFSISVLFLGGVLAGKVDPVLYTVAMGVFVLTLGISLVFEPVQSENGSEV